MQEKKNDADQSNPKPTPSSPEYKKPDPSPFAGLLASSKNQGLDLSQAQNPFSEDPYLQVNNEPTQDDLDIEWNTKMLNYISIFIILAVLMFYLSTCLFTHMCTQDDIEISTLAGVSYIVFLFVNIAMVLTNLEGFSSLELVTLRWFRWFALGWSIIC